MLTNKPCDCEACRKYAKSAILERHAKLMGLPVVKVPPATLQPLDWSGYPDAKDQ